MEQILHFTIIEQTYMIIVSIKIIVLEERREE
jgi:hypothetical protein